jgi:acyl transferase domain-containing protein
MRLLLELAVSALEDAGFADPLHLQATHPALRVGTFLSGGSLPHFSSATENYGEEGEGGCRGNRGGGGGGLGGGLGESGAALNLNLDELRSSHPSAYFKLEVGHDKDYLATAVAHALDFRGPAEAVQTACSSSLVAIARGCHAIQLGLCDGE